MIVKMVPNLKNRMKKLQESINKNLEEIKNKNWDKKTQLLKLKILQKEPIAEYLRQMSG